MDYIKEYDKAMKKESKLPKKFTRKFKGSKGD